jgi:class 3 adenylate cyclase
MNVASRMESTGVKGKIQLSQETADLIATAGKESIITPRTDKVYAKGEFSDNVGKFPYNSS